MIKNLPLDFDLEDVETIREAAVRVGVSERTVRSWIRRGQLVPLEVGVSPLLVLAAAVDDCASARDTPKNRQIARARARFDAGC